MKKVMIFGAGQAGEMISNWVSENLDLLGFIDNNSNLHGTKIEDKIIYSIDDAMNIEPDIIFISVLNKEASIQIQNQINKLDYKGQVFNINDFRDYINIRLASLRLIANQIKNLEGEVAEVGVYKGDFACEINRLFPNKELYLFDTFEGFCDKDIDIEKNNKYSKAKVGDFSDTNIEFVKNRLPYKEKSIFVKGYFPESINIELPKFCFVSLDTDLYKPTYEGLKVFFKKVVTGGVIMIHDYNSMQYKGVKEAVDKFCEEEKVSLVPLCDMHGSVVLVK